jgi:hypothetical protein
MGYIQTPSYLKYKVVYSPNFRRFRIVKIRSSEVIGCCVSKQEAYKYILTKL